MASQTAVRSLYEAYYSLPYRGPTPTLAAAVAATNRAVWAAAQQSQQTGMATTLVAAVVQENVVTVAHVGDSRAYLIYPTGIRLLTHDHTVVNELLLSGALTATEAANHPQRHILSRSLGGEEEVEVSGSEVAFSADDALLLCSDGLSNEVAESTMVEVVRSLPPQAAAERLVSLANAAGGADNITVVIVRQPRGDAALAAPIGTTGAPALRPSRWVFPMAAGFGLAALLLTFSLLSGAMRSPTPTATPTRTRSPLSPPLLLYPCRRLPFRLLPLPPRLLPQPRPSPQPSSPLLKDTRRR